MHIVFFIWTTIVWGNCNTPLGETYIKLQKRAAKLILEPDTYTPSNVLFAELKWMTVSEKGMY